MSRALLGAGIVAVGLAAALAVRLIPGQEGSRCQVRTDKVAAPTEIELGATVQVTLTLGVECPPEMAPVDVVLVIDQSSSMADFDRLTNAKAAARTFLDGMDLARSRVGLVAFNQDAGVRSHLTHQRREIEVALDSLMAGGQTNISAAIELARQELGRDPVGHQLAMIVLTDGFNTVPNAEPLLRAAQRAKDDGIRLVAVCAGGECDPDLRRAASEPALYFEVVDTSRLSRLYSELAVLLQSNGVAQLTVIDRLPANMRYILGSAYPEPAEVGTDFLRWVFSGLPSEPITYQLEPLEEGTHPTNVRASGTFTDRLGRQGQAEFPVPTVRVLVAPCSPRVLEVFFLLDDSNCLVGAWLNGMPALEAVKIGMANMLDAMNLGRDLAAVIGFGDQAILFQPLTSDRAAILAAVDQISFRDNSARLDLAFVETARELTSRRHRPNSQVVTIIVTDGPMTPAIDLAVARGEALRRQGVKHYSIAVGDSLLAQQAALRSISEPGGFYTLPYNGDVLSVFAALTDVLRTLGATCPTPTAFPPYEPSATPPVTRGWRLWLPLARK